MTADFWQKFNVFLFDFDGTLCDTEPDIKGAWMSVFQKRRISCPQFEKIFRTGPSLKEIAIELFPDCSDSFRQEIISLFGECYDSSGFPLTKPYPGIETRLQLLSKQGKKLFIVTNKRLKPMQLLLKKLRWDFLFSGVYTPDRNGLAENKTNLICSLLKEQAIGTQKAVMLGDTPGDIAAGKANHVKTCGITWGYALPEELHKAEADYIADLKDL